MAALGGDPTRCRTAPSDAEILVEVRRAVGAAVGLPEAEVPDNQPLVELGLGSLAALNLVAAWERQFGVTLQLEELLGEPTAAAVAAALAAELHRTDGRAPQADVSQANGTVAGGAPMEGPLSHGQRAMWFVHELAPESAAYNLAVALRLTGELSRWP